MSIKSEQTSVQDFCSLLMLIGPPMLAMNRNLTPFPMAATLSQMMPAMAPRWAPKLIMSLVAVTMPPAPFPLVPDPKAFIGYNEDGGTTGRNVSCTSQNSFKLRLIKSELLKHDTCLRQCLKGVRMSSVPLSM
ncbi:hypothetical protein AMTR_s00081p00051590 [Amborella trichopoda]|uniref:Uncharacterized protein n=1 Tax=Amborella trichopoda TaxID=13333 RepID=W1P979_AMBTC|nr:hypothetical protein AMTR_s00081p00051590 [Amborella trichopoda]